MFSPPPLLPRRPPKQLPRCVLVGLWLYTGCCSTCREVPLATTVEGQVAASTGFAGTLATCSTIHESAGE